MTDFTDDELREHLAEIAKSSDGSIRFLSFLRKFNRNSLKEARLQLEEKLGVKKGSLAGIKKKLQEILTDIIEEVTTKMNNNEG